MRNQIMQKIPAGYKQTEMGVIPKDWEILRLNDSSKVVDSLHQTPNFVEDGFAMVRVVDIKTGTLNLEGTLRIDEEAFQEYIKNYQPKKGDIVLSRVGSYGISSFVDTNEFFCMGQNTVVIVPKVDNKYLYYVLNSTAIRKQIEDGSYGSGYKSLSLKNIKELKLQLPKSNPEQTAIAVVLSDTDELIEHLEKLISKKKAIKQGAMQQLLTGKKRLPGFSGEWKVTNLGKVAEFVHGRGLSKSDLNEEGTNKCIHYGQLFTTYKELIQEVKSRTYKNDGCFYSRENDVLMPTSDVTPRGLATASCIKETGVILGGGILVIRLHPGYDGLYFSYFVTQNKISVLKLVKGSTVFHLYANDLATLEVCFPNFQEQIAIARVLSDMDAEIESLEQKRDKYTMLKQGMMQQLLTGRIRIYASN